MEKYLKALLVRENIDFPKTHDLEAIMAMLPSQLRPNLSADEQKALTRCAVAIRYPSELGAKSLNEAEEYLEVARRIRKDLRPLLPASALA